ncbi:MAG: hypothetical protein QOH81_447 [Sphingomonadales bacterium]|jgi:hypothetical protein|nr:hypothetical protein [Sphingomonadales bacterium]
MTGRSWTLAAAAAAVAFAVPAFAAGETGTSTTTSIRDNDGEVERVIVLTDRHREHQAEDGAAAEGRRVRIFNMNDAHVADCAADHPPLVDRGSADGHDRTRIVLCGHRELSAADRSAQLERVLERVQHMDGLSDSSKERVTAALREAIDQLRTAR